MQSQVARPSAAPAMSRGTRTARGTVIAIAASLAAATSHSLAGGEVTWLSVVATTLLALPLCVALSGRALALWQLTISVCAAQFVYHWSFASLGSYALSSDPMMSAPGHAMHLAQMPTVAPTYSATTAATSFDLAMWLGHALAAAATITLLHRGDHALRALAGLVRRVVPLCRPTTISAPRVARIISLSPIPVRPRAAMFTVISHRGPPLCAA